MSAGTFSGFIRTAVIIGSQYFTVALSTCHNVKYFWPQKLIFDRRRRLILINTHTLLYIGRECIKI